MNLLEENKVIIDGQTYYGDLNQPNLQFIKVNADCWKQIFDLLALRDILAMSQTCQRMQQIGGHYFRENFHGIVCSLDELPSSGFFAAGYQIGGDQFLRFIDTIEVRCMERTYLDHLRSVLGMGLFSSLTTLRFCATDLDENQLRGFENIQENIETIRVSGCFIRGTSAGIFFASCPKLKCLQLDHVKVDSAEAKASLFHRIYPLLEHFECVFYGTFCETFEWEDFLERNPSIKGIGIDSGTLSNIPLNRTPTFQLDYLKIIVDWKDGPVGLANRLKTLHANGWYRALRVQLTEQTAFLNQMVSFGALEALCTSIFNPNLCNFIGLEELRFSNFKNNGLEPLAKNLVNLERLQITGSIDHLLPFLRHSKKLKLIRFTSDWPNRESILDLHELNEARQTSEIKRKVRIGVDEDKYLTAKWMQRNANFDLVEIVRIEKIKQHFVI